MVGPYIHDAFQQAGADLVISSAERPHVTPSSMAWRPNDLEKKPPILKLDLNQRAEVLQALVFFKSRADIIQDHSVPFGYYPG